MATYKVWPPKDPQDVVSNDLVWSGAMETGDEITSSTWTIVSGTGLVINSQTYSDTVSRVVTSGGTDGAQYALLCQITTANGWTLEQTVYLEVYSR